MSPDRIQNHFGDDPQRIREKNQTWSRLILESSKILDGSKTPDNFQTESKHGSDWVHYIFWKAKQPRKCNHTDWRHSLDRLQMGSSDCIFTLRLLLVLYQIVFAWWASHTHLLIRTIYWHLGFSLSLPVPLWLIVCSTSYSTAFWH